MKPLAVKDGEKRSEYAKRRKSFNEETWPYEMRGSRENEGWVLLRENKSNIRIRIPKKFDEILENRFWNVLYRFGYDELNIGRHFKIDLKSKNSDLTKQINVFAKDSETVIIAECKAAGNPP